MCVYKQLTFTILGGVDVRPLANALDRGVMEDDGVHRQLGQQIQDLVEDSKSQLA